MSVGILLWLLISLNIAMIVWGFINPARVYRYPVFAAAVFAGFAIPQLIGLSNEGGIGWRQYLPEGSLDLLIVMSTLCLAALWIGDNLGVTHPGVAPIRLLAEYDQTRLLQFGFALMFVGNLIYQIAISSYSKEDLDALGSQWTGAMTIILFFFSMSKYGFTIMTYMYFRTKSQGALLCVLVGLVMTGIVFVVGARRADMANSFFVIVLGLFMTRRVVIPAWLLGAMFVVGAIWANGVGQLRGKDSTFLERFERADLIENLQHIMENGGPEMTNAAIHIWCADEAQEFDFGAIHWNHMVHAYFPGQLLGYDLKYQLKFHVRDLPLEMLRYEGPPGSTFTGMADAFESFWWFGFLKFAIVGYIMGRWYNRALRGDLWSQLAYMALMSPALHTITHHTSWLLNNYIHMMIFAWPGLAWSRSPGSAIKGTAAVLSRVR